MAQTHTHTLSYTDTIHTLQCANVIDRQTDRQATREGEEKEESRTDMHIHTHHHHQIV